MSAPGNNPPEWGKTARLQGSTRQAKRVEETGRGKTWEEMPVLPVLGKAREEKSPIALIPLLSTSGVTPGLSRRREIDKSVANWKLQADPGLKTMNCEEKWESLSTERVNPEAGDVSIEVECFP